MNRELKFRAWNFESKKMLDSHATVLNLNLYLGDESYSHVQVMQFTGLLDKNGKEVYEGDILKCERSYWKEPRNLIVKWFGERYGLENPKDTVDSEVMDKESCFNVLETEREIIGNIYQNEDLLK